MEIYKAVVKKKDYTLVTLFQKGFGKFISVEFYKVYFNMD